MNARKDHCRECAEEVSRGVAGAGHQVGCAEARRDPERSKGRTWRIAEELGVHPEALRTWGKKAEIDAGARPGTTSQDAQRIRGLEKEVRELRRANGDPAQGERVYAPRAECEAPLEVIDAFIDDNKADLGVEPICQVLSSAGVKIAPTRPAGPASPVPHRQGVDAMRF